MTGRKRILLIFILFISLISLYSQDFSGGYVKSNYVLSKIKLVKHGFEGGGG